jgi:hypothetical protein
VAALRQHLGQLQPELTARPGNQHPQAAGTPPRSARPT